MPTLRAFTLALAFFALTVLSAPVQWISIRFGWKLQTRYPHAYHKFLCRLFGIRLHVIGEPVKGRGVLMVANHTGYFDILIMSAAAPVSFVAKSEVAGWPLFGLMAKLQRSVFVDRSRRAAAADSAKVIRDRLKAGDALVLFPEGTSTDGNHVQTFKSALMGAVESEVGVDAEGHTEYVPVQPVSISYVGFHGIPLGRENRPFFAWYGDMDLMPHVWEAFKTGPLDVVVEFHAPLKVGPGFGRKQLAGVTEKLVREGQMRALQGNWGEEPPASAAAA
ncbi:lysophospholipid acyltransferase family protein [Rhizomicrobium electricum]|uniref:1-acyl-sn-glycerol-3-phosphate acyltransferase n=1 Tax=Rhizomicrobium electricum TaxID=480070 RepID=A0ABN1FCW0_9PROT|nr:lysophospholipid acyltransferase family protein [Rhizomicrobium electricum]NIJ49169.1 1-acyl-sn-glycerol-3-phosphate acyltransferase [Rhizomicrobium electricum]